MKTTAPEPVEDSLMWRGGFQESGERAIRALWSQSCRLVFSQHLGDKANDSLPLHAESGLQGVHCSCALLPNAFNLDLQLKFEF